MTPSPNTRFVRAFRHLGKEFADLMRRLLPVVALGGEAGAAAEAELRAAARITKLSMEHEAARWANRAIRLAAVTGAGQATQELLALGQKGIGEASVIARFGGPNSRLVQRLVLDTVSRTFDVTGTINTNLDLGIRSAKLVARSDAALSAALSEGVLQQEVRRKLSKRILNTLGLDKNDYIFLTSGRRWNAGKYATLVARTRPAEAENAAKMDRLEETGFEYIFIPGHGGVDPEDICYPLQGKVWALQANNPLGFPVLPRGGKLPPWHPHCMHTFSGWSPSLYTDAEIQAELDKHSQDAAQLAEVRN